MSLVFATELLREVKWLFSPGSTCPWGAIVLSHLVVFWAGLVVGSAITACVLSTFCRGLVLTVLRQLLSAGPVGVNRGRDRLAEYRY